MKPENFSLRWMIPLSIIMVIFPFVVMSMYAFYSDAVDGLTASSKNELKHRMSRIALEVEHNLLSDNYKNVQRILSVAGAEGELNFLLLVDGDGLIRASSRYAWIGLRLKEVLENQHSTIMSEALQTFNDYRVDWDRKHIDGNFPVEFPKNGKMRGGSTGMLIGEFSFMQKHKHLLLNLQQKLTIISTGMVFITFLLIMLMRQWINRPINQLINHIATLEKGDLNAKITVQAGSEIMLLADSLASMSDQLGASRQELQKSHSLLKSLIDSIPDLIFYKSIEGKYLGCNPAFCKFLDTASADQIIGKRDYDLFDRELADFFRSNDKVVLEQGKACRSEQWVSYPDGQRVLLDTLKTPYYNESLELIGLIGISRDITSESLLKEQLAQSQKMEAVGTLVGGIAHDFNNMLAGISGNLYLLESRLKGQPELTRKLNNINKLSFRAAEMIRQLLTFARKEKVKMHAFSFTSFLNEAVKLAGVAVPENVRLTCSIVGNDLVINGDVTQLQQMLMNLINNARDAAEGAESPEIHVALSPYEPDERFISQHSHHELSDKYARLSVSDNGCGIRKEQLARIFEPFFTTKPEGKGTGLGLAMVFGLIQTHNGIIDVESKPGEGSTFYIYIPLQQEIQRVFDFDASSEILLGHGETLLIADDEEHVRETLAEVLEGIGYRVIVAADGAEACRLYEENKEHISLAILDMVMPHAGGMDVAKIIRKDSNFPVLFVSGYDKQNLITKEEQLHFISKPYAMSDMSKAIRQLINESQSSP